MSKLTEFYPELQGRPESRVALDMENRFPSVPIASINNQMLKDDYVETPDYDKEVEEQEEKQFLRDLLVKAILTVILGADWTDVDMEEIDWEEIANSEIDLTSEAQQILGLLRGILKASDVEVSELDTATYDDVQNYINFYGHRSLLTGGAITDNGDGTVAIDSLTGWCPISDSETAVGKFFDWAGGNTPSLTNMTTNYIYLDYNDGTPQLVVSTSILTHGFKLDHIHVGTAFRDGTETHFHKPTNFELDLGAKVDMHHQEETFVHRVDGLVTTETGTRNLDIEAGVLYEGLNRHTSLPFNTSRSGTADFDEVNKLHDADGDFSENDVGKSVHNTTDNTYGTITAFVDSGELTLAGDTFPDGDEAYNIDFWTYHYYDGNLGTPAWVEVAGATQISNSQYNDVATGLSNFTANRYGVSWVFMEIDGLHFHVVYGQGDYKANEAEEAGVPSFLPNIVTNYCALIAKIILRQGQTTMTISYPWTTAFTTNFATNHDLLANVASSTLHTNYVLHSLADAANDFLIASGNDTFAKQTLAQTLTTLGKAAASGLASLNASTKVVQQPASISDHLDDTAGGTDAETTKAPTSNVMFDHAALAVAGTHGSTTAATANKIVHRDAAGRAKVVAPSAESDVALKSNVTTVNSALTTHEAVKSANAVLGHVIVETGSTIDVDGNGKLTLGTLAGAWDMGSQNLTNVDIDSGTIGGVTLDGTLTLGGQAFDAGSGDAILTTTGSLKGLDIRGSNSFHGPQLRLWHNHTTPDVNIIIGLITYLGYDGNASPATFEYGSTRVIASNVTDTTEEGTFEVRLATAGAEDNLAMTLSGAGALWLDAGLTIGGKLTAGANEIEGSAFDINGGTMASVTLDGAIAGGGQNITALNQITVESIKHGGSAWSYIGLSTASATFVTKMAGGAQAQRLNIQGGADVASIAWSACVHTGLKLSGALDCDGQDINNVAAPGAAGDPLIKGTRVTTAELPTLSENKIWAGNGSNVPVEADPIPAASDWKGNFNWDTSAFTTDETDISNLFSTDLAIATRRKYSVKLDLTTVEADGSFVSCYIAVKEKIDGTNYRAIDRKIVLKADIGALAEPGIIIDIPATSENIQITMQMTTATAGDCTIYYAVVKEHLE